MEIAPAYCLEGLKSIKRTFKFDKKDILMRDVYEIDGKTKITERFVSTTKPRVNGNTIALDNVYLIGSDNATLKIAEVPYSAQFPDEKGSYDQICYCFDFELKEGESEFVLKIQVGR